MAHADPTQDPCIWTGMEKVSGHRLAILTPLEDTGPWAKAGPGTGRRSWLFVGLRDQSGIIDVARVEGPMFTAGITRPQDGALLPQQAALLVGKAVGSVEEVPSKGPVGSFLSRTMGVEQGLDAAEFTVHTMPNRAARLAALDSMDHEHVALFGAAMGEHHRLKSLIPQFEGPARNADVRAPGTIDAINLANGVLQGPTGQLHADPQGPWTHNPDQLPMLEIAAIKGKVEPLFAAENETDTRMALAMSLAGQALSNAADDPARRDWIVALVNDVAGAQGIEPATRLTIGQHAGLLSAREDSPHTLLENSDKPLLYTGPALKAETLAAATRMALAVDQANGGEPKTQAALLQAPLHVLDKVGGQMLDLEARLDDKPIPYVAQKVVGLVVAPAVQEQQKAIPGLAANPLWKEATTREAMEQRAAGITVGSGILSISSIPLHISTVFDGLNDIARGNPEAKERFHRLNFRNPVDHTVPFAEAALPKAALDVLQDPHKMVTRARGTDR